MATSITNDHIESLYASALAAGAHCAKISGAGGGGFLMFLTDPRYKDRVSEALEASNPSDGTIYRCHFTPIGAQAWRLPENLKPLSA